MPSLPIYIRKANYEKIGRRAEATGKSIGAIINEIMQLINWKAFFERAVDSEIEVSSIVASNPNFLSSDLKYSYL